MADAKLRKEYEDIIARGSKAKTEDEIEKSLDELRAKILGSGLPSETKEEKSGDLEKTGSTLRGKIWKILLRVPKVDANRYIGLVEKGRSKYYDKIRDDTFRTFPKNEEYNKRVPEQKLIRVLNSFIHSISENGDENSPFSYVQGMNILAAPFLFIMPEVDAFYCFDRFVRYHCPQYVTKTLSGVHTGVSLLDEVLEKVDAPLFNDLKKKRLSAKIYSFSSVLSFCAATPPLSELLSIWDFLLAYGLHMNIVCVVAQLVDMRKELLASDSPMGLLRQLPSLKSRLIINTTVDLVKKIPDDLYDRLVRHPIEPLTNTTTTKPTTTTTKPTTTTTKPTTSAVKSPKTTSKSTTSAVKSPKTTSKSAAAPPPTKGKAAAPPPKK